MTDHHKEFMNFAVQEAQKAKSDVPVGAIIVKNGQILASAHNEKEKTNDVTAHAEIITIRQVSQQLENWRLDGAIMYVTLEPCPMCATAIIYSRISEVYFGAYDTLYGAFGSCTDMKNVLHSNIKIYGGIQEDDCSSLLKEFFKKTRNFHLKVPSSPDTTNKS
ncbi:MAG: nucleoside deaminase [Candidatus Gastranaerophilaceae bacterium]|jgi:tRNA(adenine34) deaminase